MRNRLVSPAAVLAAALFAGQVALRAAEQGQLDASPTLFSVLAAVNAAGYDADLDSPDNHPLRKAVRDHLRQQSIPVLPELRAFVKAHKAPEGVAELGQYVSFALSVDGPPTFAYRFRSHELPPDVAPLAGLETLMARFHQEAKMDELWQRVQPTVERELERYQAPVAAALLEANGYLRNPTSGYLGRRFQVYVDLLGQPNQVQSRSYRDDYFVVATPSREPRVEEIRHGYLHYLLDPLSLKYSAVWERRRSLLDAAQRAPLLEEHYKEDFLLLGTESLLKAIEARLARGEARRQELATLALREGFILVPFFMEQLPLYEKQDRALRLHYPELVGALDVKAETQRLKLVDFATERASRRAAVAPVERTLQVTGPQRTLEEAERLMYAERRYDASKEVYLRLLKETDDRTLHARAYYGLGRIAVLQKDPETGQKMLARTVELGGDAPTRTWALVYLGRLADAAGETEQAERHYRAALDVKDGPDEARKAAEKGLAKP